MLDEEQKKLVKKYCLYPSLSLTFLIVCLTIGILWLILNMLGDLVFNSTTVYTIGIWVYIGIVLVYLILFIYCFLCTKLGMRKEKWTKIVEYADVRLSNKDYSKGISALLGARGVSTLLDMSDNQSLKNASDALDVASAIGSVAMVASMTNELSSNAKTVARVFDVEIPKARKYVLSIIFIPIILLIATYIPHFIFCANNANNQALIASKSVYALQRSFETDCVNVRIDDPFEKYNSHGYDVAGYLYDYDEEYNSNINVSVNNEGLIEEITYSIDIDINKRKEENLEKAKLDILKLNVMLNDANVKALSNELLEEYELPKEFCDKFMEGSYYEKINYSVNENVDINYFTETKEDYDEYSSSYIYFTIEAAEK